MQAFLQTISSVVSVGGQSRTTLIKAVGHMEAWASQKSFPLEDLEDREVEGSDFCGQSRSNATHAAVTDPDARLCTKAPDEVARRLCQEYSRTPADRVHLRRDEEK